MADFFKCCFPSARSAKDDQDIELVSDAALPGYRRSKHNDKLKANISRPKPHPEPAILQPAAHPSNPHPYMRPRRPSEELQDLVDELEAQQNPNNPVIFSARDRAHGHVLRDLNAALQHTKWAVSGSYAEGLWGCASGKRRDIVSIMCPSSSSTTTKVWLTSQSLFTVSPTSENILDYQGDAVGSPPVSVRIRWVSDRELERLGSIKGVFSYREGPSEPVQTPEFVLLTLPALADNLALSWAKATEQRVRDDFARELFAVLDRIVFLDFALEGSGPLSANDNLHTMHKSFWVPFTKAYPYAISLFAQCGLPIPGAGSAVVTTQPPMQSMQMPTSSSRLPFERPELFLTPRSAPAPPSRDSGRSLTARSSKPSSTSKSGSSKPSSSKPSPSSKPPSASKHRKQPSSSSTKSKRPRSASKSKPTERDDPLPSPQRPVHPANIIPPPPEQRSKISALFGIGDSPEDVERRRQEQIQQDREAARVAEKWAAQMQRNIYREREREWHTKKASERLGFQDPPKKPGRSA